MYKHICTFATSVTFILTKDNLYPLTLNLPLTENLFASLHFQINIIYYFFYLMGATGRSPRCQ